jgi:thiol-disulfide isomerase/thioredoxin
MNTRKLPVFLAACSLASAASLTAAELGMTAPPLEIAHWIKGEPVNLASAKGKSIVVVEFWATWCPPCRESIPHLTELQNKFAARGVVVVGVTDEDPKVVKPFVSKMAAKMDYTVAIDRDDKTAAGYMKAFGIDGIPHAFVVNKDGVIAWQGHPLDGLEEAVEQMVAGTYDLEQVKFTGKFHAELHDYLHMASDGDSPLVRAAGRKLMADVAQRPDLLNDMAWEILTHDHDIKFRDRALALEAARKANEATAAKDPDILDTYALALFENGKVAEAVKTQRRAVELCRDDELLAALKERLAMFEKKLK